MLKVARFMLMVQLVVCFFIPPLFITVGFQAGDFSHRSKAFVRALEGSGDQFVSESSRLAFAREVAEFFDEYRLIVPAVIVVLPLLLAVSGVTGVVALRHVRPTKEG